MTGIIWRRRVLRTQFLRERPRWLKPPWAGTTRSCRVEHFNGLVIDAARARGRYGARRSTRCRPEARWC